VAFKFGQLLGGHCSFSIICGCSREDIVERRVQCVQSLLRRVESAAPSGSSRLQFSEAEINKQLQLLFATALPL